MAKSRVAALALALLLPAAARPAPDVVLHVDPSLHECEVHFSPQLTQSAFGRFVREFGSVSAFKQGAPPDVLGRWGVTIGVEQIFFRVDETSPAWNDTFTHPAADHWLGADKAFPKLRLRLGVSDDVEVGAYFTKARAANYGWLGLEAKWALLRQRDDLPVTLAVRGAYTKTLFVGDMDMHAVTADVSVGRTFWGFLTPYVAVGSDAVLARETSSAVSLRTETQSASHLTAGFELRYWHLALGAEAQLSTAVNSFQWQLSGVF